MIGNQFTVAAQEIKVAIESLTQTLSKQLAGNNPRYSTEAAQYGKLTEEYVALRNRSADMLMAISNASVFNTDETVKNRLKREHPSWSSAYDDVCVAVDREMHQRKRANKAESLCADLVQLVRSIEKYCSFAQHDEAEFKRILRELP